MLETVGHTVRRLLQIWNCSLQCHYYCCYYYQLFCILLIFWGQSSSCPSTILILPYFVIKQFVYCCSCFRFCAKSFSNLLLAACKIISQTVYLSYLHTILDPVYNLPFQSAHNPVYNLSTYPMCTQSCLQSVYLSNLHTILFTNNLSTYPIYTQSCLQTFCERSLLLRPQLYLWGSPFWVRFLCMWPFLVLIQPLR